MTRRPVSALTATVSPVTYQVWINDDVYPIVREAVEKSELSWPEWARKALSRFEAEEPDEQESLVHAWTKGRKGKTQLSFRINRSDLERAKRIAEQHGGTVQAVFAHAFFMEALAQSVSGC
jgi:hypothetical protein